MEWDRQKQAKLYKKIIKQKDSILTVSLQKTHICFFPDYFGFSHFETTKLIKSSTKFQLKQANFLMSKCSKSRSIFWGRIKNIFQKL